MIERVDGRTVIGYRVVVVKSPDLGVELADYFKSSKSIMYVLTMDFHISLPFSTAILAAFIVKEFLSHRFVIQIQYRNVSERTDCFAVNILA